MWLFSLIATLEKIVLEKYHALCHDDLHGFPTFGIRTAGARGDLPQEWQALLASQAATLAALVSRMQTAAAALCQRQPPAAWWQALAAEAERVLTVQAQEHVSLECALGSRRALAMDCSITPSALGARVRT